MACSELNFSGRDGTFFLKAAVMLFSARAEVRGDGDAHFVQTLDFAAPIFSHSIELGAAFRQSFFERLDLFALGVKNLVNFVHLASSRNVADFQKLFDDLSLPDRAGHGGVQQSALRTHEFIGAENLRKDRIRYLLQR